MSAAPLRVLLVAGEASGDLHGAAFVQALRQRRPQVEVYGIGGDYLRQAGMHVLVDTATVATMGLTEILGSAGRLFGAYRRVKRFLVEQRPDLLVLIDYPEFNLHLAKQAKRLGVPVFYYISPQIWAWRSGRVRKIAARVDRLAALFPFEAAFYERAGAKTPDGRPLAVFIGHPLLDSVRPSRSRAETRALHGLDPEQPLLAILPGSRKGEVGRLLVPALGAADLLRRQGWQAAVALAHTLSRDDLEQSLEGRPLDVPVVAGDTYDLVHAADAVLVASGTASLETALLGRPMVIMYRVSPLSYRIARRLVHVPHIGMPNLILERGVFPELIQDEVRPDTLAAAVLGLGQREAEIGEALAEVRRRLGEPGAVGRAAALALELVR